MSLSPPPASTRRERERERMRELITEAARKLFVTEGYDQVTVRRIAEAIEYTPGAIYSYFEDKDAILHALHRRGFDELGRQMAAAITKVIAAQGTPLDQLRTIGETYLAFASANPEMYDLMFVAQAPMRGDPEQWPEGKRTFDLVHGVVRTALDGGWIRPGDSAAITFTLWSMCHGMVALEFRGRCVVVPEASRATIVAAAFAYMMSVIGAAPERPVHAGKRGPRARTQRRSRPES
jgi:AcrR family transcriptional regulator